MIQLLILLQQHASGADSLSSSSFAHKWHGAQSVQNGGPFISMMASHNLIFIVLGASLIIWFVLLFFVIRTDRKITKLEERVNQNSKDSNS
ncbi:MAG TPA: hypothetical protein VE868_04660 [Balneolaceae bacterium]|nr:hypothetical protein [Balneolaceae bacterium]